MNYLLMFKNCSFKLILISLLLTLSACGGGSGNVSDNTPLIIDNNVNITYPQLKSTEGLDNPSLAFGLTGISDWHVGLPFLDLMKMSREWIGHLPNQWGGMTYSELRTRGFLDENGWPTSIPSNLSAIGTVFAWDGNEYSQGENREGEYILTYEGEGDLRIISTNDIISEEPGRIVFNISNNQGNWGFNIYDTDPNNTGDYIRNIKIIRQDRVALYNSGAIFNPEWLSTVKNIRQVRFMDMMSTNGSTIVSWSEKRNFDDTTWSGFVPIEVQVRLANEIGSDPWFNMPFHADDNFIKKFAEYVYDNLDQKLVAHVELSNEVWNWAFQQAQDSHQMAISLWTLDPNNTGGGWVNYYGKRASEVMKIWTDVFANETTTRLKRIAGTQTGNTWLSEQVITAPMWQQADPNKYVAPHTYFDALSPTTYFGGKVISSEEYRTVMLSVINNNSIDNNDFHYQLIKGKITGFDNQLQKVIDALNSQKSLADKHGLDLIAYEGGQHVHHSAFVNIPDNELQLLQEHLTGFVRSQQMADLYQELWDEWKQIGTGPFMHFVNISRPSKYGSWGLLASLTDSTPRSILIEQLNISTPAWWEAREGEHFKQGIIDYGTANADIITGTIAEDYLIGYEGNDSIYPGTGNDGVNGGGGTDTVFFSGLQSEYIIAIENVGLRIDGPDGSDYLFAVEELQFEDSKLQLSEITQ